MALPYTAPTPELAVELDEVRADALALAEIFAQINSPLPKEFPREAVVDLASALHKLPSGTAKGCLRPLTEAQSQLAAIRSQFIRHDHSEEIIEIDTPPLFRGEPVDQKLRSLMSSVSTALQTANRLAAEEPDVEEPEYSSAPLNDASTSELIRKSAEAQQEIEDEKDELDSLGIRSEPADTLSRRLTDAAVLNQLGRGELRLPRIISARLRRIAQALHDYPALIRRAAELVTTGSHVADYAHEKWSMLETRIFQAGTSTIREIAEDISNYAKKLDANRKESGQQKGPDDFDLEQATRLIHQGTLPPMHWRPLIRELPLKNRRLKSLSGLAGLTNLQELNRLSVKVNDVSILRELTSLQELDLSFTQVRDLQPVAELKQLKSLSLMGTRVSDLSPLADLPRLQHLDIDGTNVTDLNPLSAISSLTRLDLRRTKVSSLTPIAGLTELDSLYADSTSIEDITGLAHLRKLKSLVAAKTQLLDLAPIASLTDLRLVNLGNTKIKDLGPLAKLIKLESVYVRETAVKDLEPLSHLTDLKYLDLSQTAISDLGLLAGLTKLVSLQLSGTAVADLTPLSSLTRLWFLNIEATQVTDLTALEHLPHLSSIHVARTPIQSFDNLVRFAALSSIEISGDQFDKIPKALSKRGVRITIKS